MNKINNLQLINTNNFNGITCDVFADGNKIYMTRSQIGKALEYISPNDSIRRIHERHANRINKYCVSIEQTDLPLKQGWVKLTEGAKQAKQNDSSVLAAQDYSDSQIVYLYSQRGIMEICRWSRQPLADKFMDWVWDIIEAYRDGSLVPYSTDEHVVTDVMSQEQIEKLIDDKLEQFKTNELSQLKEKVMALPESDSNSDVSHVTNAVPVIPSTMQEPIDVVRSIIKPLAIALNDNTNGYNSTFRNVYDAMGVSWATRLTRYKNKHHNKNKPSKMKLIATDPKLFKLYVQTVNAMLAKVK